jgi:uncharacterized repeat protein (TIGR01451 family)
MSSNNKIAILALTFAVAVACLATAVERTAYGAEADEFLSKIVADPARHRANAGQWQAVVSGLQESESRPSAADRPRIAEAYLRSPLSFIARQEGGGEAEFSASGPSFSLLLTPHEAVMQAGPPPAIPSAASATTTAAAAAPIRLRLVGANADPNIAGEAPLPTRTNYLIGNDREKWRTGVRSFGKVRYRDVYPGTDLVYYGNHRQLEYDFVLAPGADPARIAIAFDGATPAIAPNGDLSVRTGAAQMRFRKPVIYQEGSHGRRQVAGGWKLTASGRAGFEVAAYDHGKPLVIDPVLAYSTLLGGSGNDYGRTIAVDPSGNFYVAGDTCSSNLPTTSGAYQQAPPGSPPWYCPYGGTYAGFVAKFAALSGKATGTDPAPPIYITFLGAPTYQSFVAGIAADAAGNAYVTGNTFDNNFPVTSGAFQTLCAPSYQYGAGCGQSVIATCGPVGSDDNGFVAKLNPDGTSLVYSTFIGGQGFGQFSSIAVDSAGDAYVAGWTNNENGTCGAVCGGCLPSGFNYPTTPGAYQTVTRADANAGIPNEEYWWVFSKLSADGSTLLYSTELYGTPDSSQNYAQAIAINPSDGTAYLAGQTGSAGFPSTPGAAQPALKGGQDAFIARFDPSKSGTASLVFGTFLGGSGDEAALGIAVDSSGNAYVAGGTGNQVFENGPESTDFPTTADSFQPTCPGDCPGSDAGWVAKLSPAGKKTWATYLGGTGTNNTTIVTGIAVGSADQAIVTGCTSDGGGPYGSTSFPLVSQIPGILIGNSSRVIVTKFSASGKTLLLSNEVGGWAADDCGAAIAMDASSNPYVFGTTASTMFPTTPGAFQTGSGSGQDDTLAFTFRNTDTDVGVSDTPSPNPAIHGETLTYTIVAESTGTAMADAVVITAQTPAGTTFQSAAVTAGSCTVPAVGERGNVRCSGFNLAPGASATLTLDVLVKAASGATITDTVTVNKHANDYDLLNNTASVSVPVQ